MFLDPLTIQHLLEVCYRNLIYEKLQKVIKLPEKERKKAIKHLFFTYHPDTSQVREEEKELYEQAFKYLNCQVATGLEDPKNPEENSSPPVLLRGMHHIILNGLKQSDKEAEDLEKDRMRLRLVIIALPVRQRLQILVAMASQFTLNLIQTKQNVGFDKPDLDLTIRL